MPLLPRAPLEAAFCPIAPIGARLRAHRLINYTLVLLTGLLGSSVATIAHAQTPAHLWSRGFSGSANEQANSVAVDALGNVFITGYFEGTVAEFGTSAGSADVFLAKYNANGVFQWGQRYGSTGGDYALAVDIDAAGNVIVAGEFSGFVDFGSGPKISQGQSDVFVAKYTTSGAPVWSQSFGGVNADQGLSVAADGSSNVLVSGGFIGNMTVSGNLLVNAGNVDGFVVKYNSAGTYQWSKQLGGVNSDDAKSVATDGLGNVIVAGSFSGTVNFGGANLVSSGPDLFLAKYNMAGTHIWSQGFGGAATDRALSVATDFADNVLVAGSFSGTANFGGSNLVSAGSADILLAKYNPAGAHQWSQGFGTPASDAARGVVADASGNVIMVGYFNGGTVNFGGLSLTGAGLEICLAKFNAAGTHVWSQRFGGPNSDTGQGVAVDPSGNVAMTGVYNGPVSFGGAVLPASGSSEMFTAKYGADRVEPAIESVTDLPNDQGREVTIKVGRGYYDRAGSASPILQYEVYRRNDAPPPTQNATSLSPGASAAKGSEPAGLSTREQLLTAGWQFVSLAPAHGELEYHVGAPTRGDSTIALGQYRSVFFVRAATSNPLVYYDSPIDSGYSVDNLAPPAPLSFIYSAGNLTWLKSAAADFDYFTVYGSASMIFDGSATMIDQTTGINLNVTGSPHVFYYATATDFSGNEGKAARVNTLSGANGPPKPGALAVSAYPNPFNPRTTIRYDVPSAGRVVVTVYDAGGARVATLVDFTVSAGSRTVVWDGRNDTGETVSSGIYLVEVRSGTQTKTRKLALVK